MDCYVDLQFLLKYSTEIPGPLNWSHVRCLFGVNQASELKPSLIAWTGVIHVAFLQFLRPTFFKVSLNIAIRKLYTNGLTIEFSRCKACTNHNTSWGKHSGHKSLVVYNTTDGSQNKSDAEVTW